VRSRPLPVMSSPMKPMNRVVLPVLPE